MTVPIGPGTPSLPDAAEARKAALRAQAVQLEGMFVRQLFAAMRETVPKDGLMSGGAGEEMFTAMRDEHLADALPAQWSRGLAASIVRELAGRPAAPSEQP